MKGGASLHPLRTLTRNMHPLVMRGESVGLAGRDRGRERWVDGQRK